MMTAAAAGRYSSCSRPARRPARTDGAARRHVFGGEKMKLTIRLAALAAAGMLAAGCATAGSPTSPSPSPHPSSPASAPATATAPAPGAATDPTPFNYQPLFPFGSLADVKA